MPRVSSKRDEDLLNAIYARLGSKDDFEGGASTSEVTVDVDPDVNNFSSRTLNVQVC
jgi:hypothetical protein